MVNHGDIFYIEISDFNRIFEIPDFNRIIFLFLKQKAARPYNGRLIRLYE